MRLPEEVSARTLPRPVFGRERLVLAVMSYEMGPLLDNCLASLRRNAPGIAIRIYDDGSADAETNRILANAGAECRVWQRNRSTEAPTDRKTGGLHANMNRALRDAGEDGFAFVGFVQDDTQLVRLLDSAFFSEYHKIWTADPHIGQIRWMFTKDPSVNPGHVRSQWVPADSGLFYGHQPSPQGILDTGIVCLPTLQEAGFHFEDGEGNNARRSVALGLIGVFPKNPVCAWLPWPPTARHRLPLGKRLFQGFTDWYFRVGFHPLRDMTPEEVEDMVTRNPDVLPQAERFLELARHPSHLPTPWHYEHSYAYIPQVWRRMWAR